MASPSNLKTQLQWLPTKRRRRRLHEFIKPRKSTFKFKSQENHRKIIFHSLSEEATSVP
jgi:hypothetical protein